MDDTLEIIRDVRELRELRAVAVLNGADYSGNRNQEALDGLAAQNGLEVCPYALVRRTAYPSAADEGLGVLEYTDPGNRYGSAKAREDFIRLMETLYPALEWRLTA